VLEGSNPRACRRQPDLHPRSKLVLLMSDEVLRALRRDERVMTESMAVKGYADQPWRDVRELELSAPDGTPGRVTVRVR
jgi:hypothetical protein